MSKRSFAPMFPSKLVEKDLTYALAAGKNSALPLVETTREVFRSAVGHGWADENLSSVIKVYE